MHASILHCVAVVITLQQLHSAFPDCLGDITSICISGFTEQLNQFGVDSNALEVIEACKSSLLKN